MASVQELIAKLKREVPELEHNPLLDEIEVAAVSSSQGEPDEGSPDEEAKDQTEGESDVTNGDTGNYDDQSSLPPVPAMKKKMPPYKK